MQRSNALLDADLLLKIEDDLAARMAALFRRCPALQGFAVRDWPGLPEELLGLAVERKLPVGDLGVFPLLGAVQFEEIYDEIAAALLGLLAAQPAAMLVLRGRTIARVVQ